VTLKEQINHCQQRLDHLLENWLPAKEIEPQRLHSAMRYSSLNAGKRLRPLLVYMVGEALGAEETDLDAAALALECIHVYSLIHDDLPAMDDDHLRRGKATCHIAYDEATAILAGDALQTLAFEILANHPLSAKAEPNRTQLIQSLAQASGSQGMGGGQMIDLLATNQFQDISQLQAMHRMKTGALIRCCVSMAISCSGINEPKTTEALEKFGDLIGLAFQVKDDILDVEGDTAVIGKPSGSDSNANKSTFPALLGLDEAKKYAKDLIAEALLTLDGIPYNTGALKQVSNFIIERQN